MEHGIDAAVVAVIAASAVLWSLTSDRRERVNITAPMALAALRVMFTQGPFSVIDVGL
jgi:hypothetical protein